MFQRFGLLTTFTMAVSMLAWREMRQEQRMPQPQKFIYAAIVWAILGVFADLGAPELATLFGIGFVIALYYNGHTIVGDTKRQAVDHTVPGES